MAPGSARGLLCAHFCSEGGRCGGGQIADCQSHYSTTDDNQGGVSRCVVQAMTFAVFSQSSSHAGPDEEGEDEKMP